MDSPFCMPPMDKRNTESTEDSEGHGGEINLGRKAWRAEPLRWLNLVQEEHRACLPLGRGTEVSEGHRAEFMLGRNAGSEHKGSHLNFLPNFRSPLCTSVPSVPRCSSCPVRPVYLRALSVLCVRLVPSAVAPGTMTQASRAWPSRARSTNRRARRWDNVLQGRRG
jgi:hypothetical protein